MNYVRCLIASLGIAGCVLTADDNSKRQITDTLKAAVEAPTARHFEALKAVLPRSGNYFIVEGDLRMTEQELRVWLDRRAGRADQPSGHKDGELIVNLRSDGRPDYYERADQRTLTYSIQRTGFSEQQYIALQEKLAGAARAWENACPSCGIHYVRHEPDLAPAEVTFIVRKAPPGSDFLAASFFPADAPARKTLDVDETAFSPDAPDLEGVLRHELGHTLGYRHEHIRDVPGCAREDDQWKPITEYDPKSVMHYFCGGRGNLKLTLTALDIEGHRRQYSGTRVVNASPGVKLVVDFQGGLVPVDVADVLVILDRSGLLPKREHTLKSGESVPQVYASVLKMPWISEQVLQLAKRLNRNTGNRTLLPDDTILVPDVTIETFPFTRKFDNRVASERAESETLQATHGYLLLDRPVQTNTVTKVELRGYRLTIGSKTPGVAALVEAQKKIQELNRKNIESMVVGDTPKADTPKNDAPQYYSVRDPKDWINRREWKRDEEGALGRLINLPESVSDRANCAATAPLLVLLDQPVYNHPNLGDSVENAIGPVIPPEPDGATLRALKGDFNKDVDHGTHLAGMLTGRSIGYGIIGIDPADRLYSLNWNDLRNRPDQLKDTLQNLDYGSRRPIFVFANAWNPSDNTGKIVTRKIRNLRNLWIAAAGQADDGQEPAGPLTEQSSAPMSLGTEPYVIVVTACEQCYGPSPRLPRWANYSDTRFVHIAAPGDGIPSTISQGLYGQATGTSQAAAFVAGVVASLMRSTCQASSFPYDRPERIKNWLQLTSRPNLRSFDGKTRMDFGVLDGRAVTLDPRSSYVLRDSTEPGSAQDYKLLTGVRWCRDSIELQDEYGERLEMLNTADIRRIVQQDHQWFLYSIRESDPVPQVRRIGPGVLKDRLAVVTAADGVYKMDQIQDLILSRGVGRGNCPVR